MRKILFSLMFVMVCTLPLIGEGATYQISNVNDYLNIEENLTAGDIVQFERGKEYRLNIDSVSGVTYKDYGNGAKPLLLGSTERNSINDWTEEGTNIWYTEPITGTLGSELISNTSFNTDLNGWFYYFNTNNGASGSIVRDTTDYDSSPACLRLDITNDGSSSSDIQLYVTNLNVE